MNPKKPEPFARIGDSLFISLLQEMREYYGLVLRAQEQGDTITEFTLRAVCRTLEDELGIRESVEYYYAMMAPHEVRLMRSVEEEETDENPS
jgi:hypothetical protein